MKVAYVDTSAILAVVLGEATAPGIATTLGDHEALLSSNLLEAELRSTLEREGVEEDATELVRGIQWVMPSRPLSAELARVLACGYTRGADAWHLACALYLSPRPDECAFVTLDQRQARVARQLGFPTPAQAHE